MSAWSWVLTAVGVFGLYLAGRKVWWAWFVGLAAQALWLAYAITTHQFGFVVSAFAYGWVYLRNGRQWMREHKARTKHHNYLCPKPNPDCEHPTYPRPDLAWWVISSEAFQAALHRAHTGEDPDLLYVEFHANSNTDTS